MKKTLVTFCSHGLRCRNLLFVLKLAVLGFSYNWSVRRRIKFAKMPIAYVEYVVLSGERTSLLLPIFIIQMKMEVLRLL